MPDSNKTKQASIYATIFSTEKIDYDDFLISPNDYIRERYFSSLNPKPGDYVLEIGIGISTPLARAVKTHRITAFGLDYVEPSLVAQKQNSPFELNLCRGDAEALPYKDGTFDSVIAISVLEHLSDYDQAFKELRRILKPGGTCLLQLPCRDFRVSLFARLKTYDQLKTLPWFNKNQEISGHEYERIPERARWLELAAQNGFTIRFYGGSDILLDSWMMYYFHQWVKNAQSALIRFKKRINSDSHIPDRQTGQKRPMTSHRKYSLKRTMVGFAWYHIILRGFWIILRFERIFAKLPIGASIFLCIKKSGLVKER